MEDTSPKIYLLRHKFGRFLNIEDGELRLSFTNGTYFKDKTHLLKLLALPLYKDYSLFIATEKEFMTEIATNTTDLVIAGEYLSQLLIKVDHKIPTISQINKNLHTQLQRLISMMKPFTKWHSEFLEEKEDLTDDVSGHYSGFITELGQVELYKVAEATMILHALRLDRSSMIGITKKVLKNNNIKVKIIK